MQVIEAIVGLAAGLELSVVIEVVETPQQHAILRRAGCDVAQGYGIAKPMMGPELEAWLASYGSPSAPRLA